MSLLGGLLLLLLLPLHLHLLAEEPTCQQQRQPDTPKNIHKSKVVDQAVEEEQEEEPIWCSPSQPFGKSCCSLLLLLLLLL
jgi:hypothetical protein